MRNFASYISAFGVPSVDGTDFGYRSIETYSPVLLPGKNELVIRVIGYKYPTDDPLANSAGVAFRVRANYNAGPPPLDKQIFLPSLIR